jgi:hypothetical protein
MSKPTRLLFKSVEDGDLRKLEARSNDSKTGGGARDLRMPHKAVERVVPKMFPTVVQETRSRNKERQLIDLRKAQLVYADDDGQVHEIQVCYEPPTTARPSEGRITRIHEIPALAKKYLPNQAAGRRLFLFIQHDDGKLRARYVSDSDLTNPPAGSPKWNKLAKETILEALRVAPPGKSACGWVDFTTGEWHVHS